MTGDCHVQFGERLVGKFRRPTHLDFTILQDAATGEAHIELQLKKIADWIYENTGIEIPEIFLDIFPDSGGKVLRGKIAYIGPLQQKNSYTRVKLDLTQNEFLATSAVKSQIHHPYEDHQDLLHTINSYSYEEIFAEKIRALLERARPRDLFDVVHLFERKANYSVDVRNLKSIIQEKLAYRSLRPITKDSSITKTQISELVQEWDNMLAHQIGNLEPARVFLNKLPNVMNWIVDEA